MGALPLEPIHRLPYIASDPQFGSVDLWCFYYDRISDPALLAAYEGLMAEDEHARYRRFLLDRDRRMFLATRALVRTVLSAYADVEPRAWRFAEGVHGKPYIAAPAGLGPLHFNLTNTRGLVMCAVSRTHAEIGVDAEWLERAGETVGIAEHYFASAEIRALRALPRKAQRNRFFGYWTLKESYIKARGLGLALPLDQFSFLLDEGPPIRIAFEPGLADNPEHWRFGLFLASPSHIVAVSVQTVGTPLFLAASNFVPLCGALPFDAAWPLA